MGAPETDRLAIPDEAASSTLDREVQSYDAFELGEVVGVGGNATVYEATVRDDGVVALKQPHVATVADPTIRERFRTEAETWAEIDEHDHVVTVHAWGIEPVPWIALEYMDGGDLTEWVDECGLDHALWVGACVATAVDHAHRNGVAHLDLRPENVLFRETAGDAWAVPKVADWGMATALRERAVNLEGLSPRYAAPEQLAPDQYGPVGAATDVYQLGVVLYELLVGRAPFDGPPRALRRAVLDEQPPPPSGREPALDPAVDDLLDRALAKDPGDRYESMYDFRRAIESLLADGADPDARLAGTRGGDVREAPPDAHSRLTPEDESGQQSDANPYERALTLADEGFVQLSEGYFARRDPAPPLAAWRRGVRLVDAAAGRAVERTIARGDAETRRSLGDELLAGLLAGSDHVVLGPPGSGKSTVCKRVACEWFDRGRGPVFYRESGGGTRFDRPDELTRRVANADGHALVVVEDAVRPEARAVFELLDRVADSEDVSVLVDARDAEWREAGRGTDPFGDGTATGRERLESVSVPHPDTREHERFVEAVETATDRPVDVDVDQLRAEVHRAAAGDAGAEETQRGELFYLLHRLTSLARDPLDGDAPTTLTEAVADTYDRLADCGEHALDVGVCVNVCNAAGVGVHPELLYAVVPDDPLAVDEAIDVLDGRAVFPREADWSDGTTAYPAIHEAWSAASLDYCLEADGERDASERFGRVVGRLLSLAEDDAARDRVAGALRGDAPYLARIESDPGGWADETARAIYRLGEKRLKLAPLFGDGDRDTVALPAVCSDRVVDQRPVWLGRMFLAGGYFDRAQRAYERLPAENGALAVERRLGLARVALERGEYDDTVAHAEACLSLVEGDDRPVVRARAHLRIGKAMTNMGAYEDAATHYRTALDGFETADDRRRMAETLNNLGELDRSRGEFESAVEYLQRSLDIQRELGNQRGAADCLTNLGESARLQGDYDRARESLQRALEIQRELGRPKGESYCLGNLGLVVRLQGDHARARDYFQRSLEIQRELGDRRGEAISLGNLGEVALAQGDSDDAREYFERSLDVKRELGDRQGEAYSLANLGLVACRHAEYDRAREYHERTLDVQRDLGDSHGEAVTLANLGTVAHRQGDYDRAREYFQRSLEMELDLGVRHWVASSCNHLGAVALHRGRYERARDTLDRARDIITDVGDSLQAVTNRRSLGELARLQGDYDSAREHFDAALDAVDGEPFELTRVRLARARLALDRGDVTLARERARAVRETFAEMGATHWEARARYLLGRVAAEAGETATAREHWRDALETFDAVEAPQDSLDTLRSLVDSCRTVGADDRAEQYRRRAERLLDEAPPPVADQHRAWLGRECSPPD